MNIYIEKGRSGKDLKRPELQRMMGDIENGKIDTVIIWKIDRLTRSIKDFSMLWDEFQKRDIQLVSLNEDFNTTTAIGRAMLSLVLVFAQLEREQTAERTSTTMRHRAEKGLWNGGRLMGYDIDTDNKGILKVNSDQAKIVNRAFDLCIEKGSAGQVQKTLNEYGYQTPEYESRRGKKHGGTMFSKQSVIKMLSNPFYIGKIRHNGKLYKGKHKAIISTEKFDKVQKILEKNRKTRSNQKIPTQHVYLLSGILRCGKCGAAMTPKSGRNRTGKPYYYYQCTKNSHIGKKACDVRYIPAEQIENFIVERVKELTVDENEIKKMVAKANGINDKQTINLRRDRENVSLQLKKIEGKLQRIIETIEAGYVSGFKFLDQRIKSLEQEWESLKEKLELIDLEISEIEQNRLSSAIMLESFQSFRDVLDNAKPQKLKEMLYRIVEVVEWHEDEKDKGSGHCKISYFEQPHFKMPKKLGGTDGKQKFAQSNDWLLG